MKVKYLAIPWTIGAASFLIYLSVKYQMQPPAVAQESNVVVPVPTTLTTTTLSTTKPALPMLGGSKSLVFHTNIPHGALQSVPSPSTAEVSTGKLVLNRSPGFIMGGVFVPTSQPSPQLLLLPSTKAKVFIPPNIFESSPTVILRNPTTQKAVDSTPPTLQSATKPVLNK